MHATRTIVTISLITCFITIAVFGFFGMDNHDAQGNPVCIAVTAHGGACATGTNALTLVGFYLTTFVSFSTATFSDLTSLLALIILLVIFAAFFWRQNTLACARLSVGPSINATDALTLPKQLCQWLSLFEHSPSA